MPTIYRVTPGGYHTSHSAATKEARELADAQKTSVMVDKLTIPGLTLPLLISALNGWGVQHEVEPAGTVQPRKAKR